MIYGQKLKKKLYSFHKYAEYNKSTVCLAEASVNLTLLMCEYHSITRSVLLSLLPEDNKPRGAAQAGRVCDAGPRQLPGHVGDTV